MPDGGSVTLLHSTDVLNGNGNALNLIGCRDHQFRVMLPNVGALWARFPEASAFPLFDSTSGEKTSGNLFALARATSIDGALSLRKNPAVEPLFEISADFAPAKNVSFAKFVC